jgi:hypothetical protein
MAQKKRTVENNTQQTVTNQKSSYSAVIERINNILGQYQTLPMDSIYGAFGRAMGSFMANNPILGNQRVKAINPLPADITKEELGEALRYPQGNERILRQVSEGLRWTNYSYNKIISSYANMLNFHTLILPKYLETTDIKSDAFRREYRLICKIIKGLNSKENGRKIAQQTLTQGKVFYVPRYSVDKSHNKLNYFFLQQLPSNYVLIEGFNNISGYTISFDLTYFLQMGTDYRQFGDLFEPFMDSFNEWYTKGERKSFKGKFVYATHNNESFESEVKAWQQNGRFMYYVSLPIDKVWTFEIDNQSPIVASPFSGLMQTFAQQADYEAAQLSLVLNPLIKIFTGEMPYYESNSAKEDDGYRLSLGGRALFEALFDNLMARNNTGGTAFYTAPVKNIHGWDYSESANANDVSNSFLTYSANKVGLNALVPINENPHQGVSEYSAKLESQFAQNIYHTFEKMLNYILESINLNFEWRIQFFGDIYSDELVRTHALKLIDKGDLYGWYLLSALDDISIYERTYINGIVSDSGLMELLQPPQTAYTQSSKSQPQSDTGGAPEKSESDRIDTQIEKQTETTENGTT